MSLDLLSPCQGSFLQASAWAKRAHTLHPLQTTRCCRPQLRLWKTSTSHTCTHTPCVCGPEKVSSPQLYPQLPAERKGRSHTHSKSHFSLPNASSWPIYPVLQTLGQGRDSPHSQKSCFPFQCIVCPASPHLPYFSFLIFNTLSLPLIISFPSFLGSLPGCVG